MTILSLPNRAVQYAWRRSNEARYKLRGKYILHRYSAHYRQARRVFDDAGEHRTDALGSLYDIGVRVIDPAVPGNPLVLSPGYPDQVARVARNVSIAFERTANCHFFPGLAAGEAPERTADVPEIANGDVITMQLLDPLAIDGLRELGEPLLRAIEPALYGSFVIADKVYIYRNPVSHQTPRTSWRWHFDNHPREMLKVMVYLTDVSEETAPFQYLREQTSGRPRYGAPLTPLFGHSRVSDVDIARQLSSGCTFHSVVGPQGTIVVFDDNVVHRATLAKRAHRDVVVFQIRPAAFEPDRRIDPRWTGSFNHAAINGDPWTLTPRPKE